MTKKTKKTSTKKTSTDRVVVTPPSITPKKMRPVRVRRPKPPTAPEAELCRLPIGSSFLGDSVSIQDGHAYKLPGSQLGLSAPDSWVKKYKDVSALLKKETKTRVREILDWMRRAASYGRRLAAAPEYEYSFALVPAANGVTPCLGFKPYLHGLTSKEVAKLCKEFSV